MYTSRMNEQALNHLCQGSSSVRVSLVHAPNNIIVRVRSLSYIKGCLPYLFEKG